MPPNINLSFWNEVTDANSPDRKFKEAAVALRAGGQQVGATGKTARGLIGASSNPETLVEYVFEDKISWMPEVWWEMYFDKPYPANQ